jgi:hypothetical protein
MNGGLLHSAHGLQWKRGEMFSRVGGKVIVSSELLVAESRRNGERGVQLAPGVDSPATFLAYDRNRNST